PGLPRWNTGQGSAPIAHAAARTKEPVAEGMVAILEPFIDTLLICTLTGLVILSSGVWVEKFQTDFTGIDTQVLDGRFDDTVPADRERLFGHLNGVSSGGAEALAPVTRYTGTVAVVDGNLAREPAITVLHNRSVAERVRVTGPAGAPWSGTLNIEAGRLTVLEGVTLSGESLLHSVPLTIAAFKRSFLGDWGQYIVSVGLALFAFSTALAWSYYGDRAVTYLVGTRWVTPYRWLYVAGFFIAAISDTSLIWLLSAITLALMTLPNLFGLLLMRKEIRQLTERYWGEHRRGAKLEGEAPGEG
ncbi:MAG: alanine:cation symporter family protein, partial [Pseudomonadota bacterium]